MDPPPAERSAVEAPTLAEEKQILDHAVTYTVAYAKRLPNLMCRERIRRFDNETGVNPRADVLGGLRLVDTLVAQVTYSKSEERADITAVNGAPVSGSPTVFGITTFGDFGDIMIAPFHPGSHTKAVWSHWEVLHGKRVAVLRYSVAAADSHYRLAYCCEDNKPATSVTSAYRGFLFLEAATGAVVRITRSSTGLPTGFPTRQVDTEVEYGPVTIGEQAFMCPIRSVTKVASMLPSYRGEKNALVISLNTKRFTDYREFQAEGRLVATAEPGSTSPPKAALPASAPNVPRNPSPEMPDLEEGTSEAAPGTLDALFSIPKLARIRRSRPARTQCRSSRRQSFESKCGWCGCRWWYGIAKARRFPI